MDTAARACNFPNKTALNHTTQLPSRLHVLDAHARTRRYSTIIQPILGLPVLDFLDGPPDSLAQAVIVEDAMRVVAVEAHAPLLVGGEVQAVAEKHVGRVVVGARDDGGVLEEVQSVELLLALLVDGGGLWRVMRT